MSVRIWDPVHTQRQCEAGTLCTHTVSAELGPCAHTVTVWSWDPVHTMNIRAELGPCAHTQHQCRAGILPEASTRSPPLAKVRGLRGPTGKGESGLKAASLDLLVHLPPNQRLPAFLHCALRLLFLHYGGGGAIPHPLSLKRS